MNYRMLVCLVYAARANEKVEMQNQNNKSKWKTTNSFESNIQRKLLYFFFYIDFECFILYAKTWAYGNFPL